MYDIGDFCSSRPPEPLARFVETDWNDEEFGSLRYPLLRLDSLADSRGRDGVGAEH
jgi:hypothetical protein